MNTNLRALLFGAAVAVALTVTLNTVYAAETLEIVRLDGITVTAHRAALDVDGEPAVIHLDPIVVTAKKSATE